MKKRKHIIIAERIECRIERGDYNVLEFPAERELAVQVGVSYVTARKAVIHLIEKGLLRRLPNGRATPIFVDAKGATKVFALLTPAWESQVYNRWRIALNEVCKKENYVIRRVLYSHWDDPVISATLKSFDGVFLFPEPEKCPEAVIELLQTKRDTLTILEEDWSDIGFFSVITKPISAMRGLLEHLASLGHKKIDYFNAQPSYEVFLQPWRLWIEAQGFEGECFNCETQPYEETKVAAYNKIRNLLEDKKFYSKALLCTTEAAAEGVIAALLDAGIVPGKDIAIVACDYGINPAFYNPSITSLAEVDVSVYAKVCIKRVSEERNDNWTTPMLLQPDNVPIIIRQSTCRGSTRHREI